MKSTIGRLCCRGCEAVQYLGRCLARQYLAAVQIELVEDSFNKLNQNGLNQRFHEQKMTMDFMARLAALVPQPRANLTSFHGVFARTASYARK